MGGGGSFSAGGPGKGMYTRLYTNVLNRYHWMYSATAFNHAYMDSGVFCISSSAHPQQIGAMAQVIVHELAVLASGKIRDFLLERFKYFEVFGPRILLVKYSNYSSTQRYNLISRNF